MDRGVDQMIWHRARPDWNESINAQRQPFAIEGLIASIGLQHVALFFLCLSALLLALHGLHPAADAPTKFGWFTARNFSGDLYTDEGWATAGATHAALRGSWYLPGDFNLAVDAPMWSMLLYLPFKIFGPTIVVARALSMTLYGATIVALYFLVKRSSSGISAALLTVLIAANFFGLVFGRLATMEALWVFFVVLAILAAQSAWHKPWTAVMAGMFVGFAVLAKLTAVFAIAPVLLMMYLGLGRTKAFWQRAAASLLALAVIAVPYRIVMFHLYPADHKLYARINLEERKITSVKMLARHLAHVVFDLRTVDPALYVCCALGLCAALYFVPKRQVPPLAWLGMFWLGCNMLVVSSINYFPPRYCYSLLFPIALLAVLFAKMSYEYSRPLGICLYALLAVSCVHNVVQSFSYEFHPRYSYLDFAKRIETNARKDGVDLPLIMGGFANTISLYTASRSLNDLGTVPLPARISTYKPSYYVSVGPATPEIQRSFATVGKSLRLEDQGDVLENYTTGHPLYLYRVDTAGQ